MDSNPYPQHYSVPECSNSLFLHYIFGIIDISVSRFLFVGPKYSFVITTVTTNINILQNPTYSYVHVHTLAHTYKHVWIHTDACTHIVCMTDTTTEQAVIFMKSHVHVTSFCCCVEYEIGSKPVRLNLCGLG